MVSVYPNTSPGNVLGLELTVVSIVIFHMVVREWEEQLKEIPTYNIR